MISIQELGTTILSEKPNSLYIIGGQEYGVKQKYIDKLTSLYGEKVEYPTLASVIDLMSTRHLIPMPPKLYVVRYDENLVSTINEAFANKVKKAKIIGTIVCIYDSDKHISKIDKYLPEFTCEVSAVDSKFIEKYLHSDFPNLDDRSIKIAVYASDNYSQARNICNCMIHADLTKLNTMSEADLINLFGCSSYSDESAIQLSVAARDFRNLVKLIEKFPGDLDSLLYTILRTMLELEKIRCSKYSDSPLAQYSKLWTIQDIYYMFMHTYGEIKKLRSSTAATTYTSLIYLFALLTFQQIPSTEVMNEF